MSIQASDIQDMYIQVSVLLVSIYRYHVFRYVYTGIRYSNMYIHYTGSGLQYLYTGSRSRKDVFTDFYRYVYTGIRSKGMY